MDGQDGFTVVVPERLRHLMSEAGLAAAWELQVAARKAEAAKVTALLDHVAACRDEHAGEPEFVVQAAERAAIHQAALVWGFSDQTTAINLHVAEWAREWLPWCWEAFIRGMMDLLRLRKVTTAAQNLTDEYYLPLVDSAAAWEALGRGVGDFQNWLVRFIAKLDEQAYADQCAREREDRWVQFSHGAEGMSYIEARLPTVEAAAIQKRLHLTARRHHSQQDDDQDTCRDSDQFVGQDCEQDCDESVGAQGQQDRPTVAQREADLFSAWLRTGDTPETGIAPVEAKVMVMIPEATLTGESDRPGMAADRSWMVDAETARALALNPEADHEWYQGTVRLIRADADVDLLSASYIGRFPPQRLRDGLIFRDGVCVTQGCTVPAERADIDHRTPWEAGGATAAANLQALCRRHHRLKSHGFLQPQARAGPPRDSPSK